ncbi:cation diffusion facilitator family transporter [Alcanivorax sp. 1008]|uniref:cation diffusion facilitator family transporter n=1 Tax=Alcanivorax sp. 1008 TaxID=2816853 RepID=UPI001D7322BD|nr:cation diffusion facilitator family transporter [Alcanivorax sp. 1008]MCC1495576.1 cation diffusion facilitator family transporter [Alcanivorax sp. 1008]
MKNLSDSRLMLLTGVASVLTAVLLISVKLVAWYLSDSVAMLASLVDSLMDAAASLVNLLAIRYSLVPADAEHRFGHGKAEALAGLGQAVLITLSALFLLNESVGRLLSPQPLEATTLAVGVMVFSIVVTLALLRLQSYTVKRTGSTAVEADSLHYLSDLAMNGGILLALIGASFGLLWLDGLAGVLIGLYVLRAAWQVGHHSSQLLLDREMSADVRQVIASIVAEHPLALGFHQLRTRESGRTCFIQMHVDMDENLTLRDAHDLVESIERRIHEHFPEADVLIHQDPVRVSPKVPLQGPL